MRPSQQAAAEQEASDIQSVEDALRAKIAHTEALKQAVGVEGWRASPQPSHLRQPEP